MRPWPLDRSVDNEYFIHGQNGDRGREKKRKRVKEREEQPENNGKKKI